MNTSSHPLTLLCGLCPTRRVVGHIRVFTDREAPLVMASTGRRQWRPKQAQPVTWEPVADGARLRVRCTKRHPWEPAHDKLLAVCLAAADRGRRDLTLGVDL